MGADGTGVAKDAVGPIGIGIGLDVTEPEVSMDRFSKISRGDD